VADFDLGSVPWAVEAAETAMRVRWQEAQRNGEWDQYDECIHGLAEAGLAAFLSARGPCPNPRCVDGRIHVESVQTFTYCPTCLGSPGSGPTLAEKLTSPARWPRRNGPRCPVCDRLNIDDQPCRECKRAASRLGGTDKP
jgi:hypothetical protein